MPGLTAKVFRTYNASITLQQQLDKLTKGQSSFKIKNYANNGGLNCFSRKSNFFLLFDSFLISVTRFESVGRCFDRLQEDCVMLHLFNKLHLKIILQHRSCYFVTIERIVRLQFYATTSALCRKVMKKAWKIWERK